MPHQQEAAQNMRSSLLTLESD